MCVQAWPGPEDVAVVGVPELLASRVTYVNGDQVDFLDIVFRCRWVSGDPHPADGELSEVGFYDLAAMGDIDDAQVRKIALAVAEDDPAHFRGGRTAR